MNLEKEKELFFKNFKGFKAPQTTQVPDVVFDRLLRWLDNNELRVLFYIMRHTLGWKKDSDNISLNQMANGIKKADGTRVDYGAGLSKASACRGVKGLVQKNLIGKNIRKSPIKGDESTTYKLKLIQKDVFRVSNRYTPLFKSETGGVSDLNTQQTTIQQSNRYRYVFNNRDVRDVVSFFNNLFPEHKGTLRFKDVRVYLSRIEKNQLVANIGALKFNVKRNPAGYLRTVFEKGDGKIRVSKEGGKRKMMEETQKKVQQWKEELRKSKERTDKLMDIYKKLPEETKQKIRLKAENIIGNTLKFGKEKLVELEILAIVEEEYQK